MRYALKEKGFIRFSCISYSEDEFEAKIQKAYWSWRGMKSQNELEESKSIEEYLKSYDKVHLIIRPL